MRSEDLREGWLLQGRVPGAAVSDVRREISLPFALTDLADACGREGLFLRAWELEREIAFPKEPPHSRAERALLTLDGVVGQGRLFVGGRARGPLRPHMELDVSEETRGGPCRLLLRFEPHLPRLYPGERGRELPVETRLQSARLRSVFRLRIEEVRVRGLCAHIVLHAYGAARARLCLRLLQGESLRFSENLEVDLRPGRTEIERFLGEAAADFARLRLRVDVGGEGCDEAETYREPERAPRALAHFFARPQADMLLDVRRAGFDAAALHVFADEALRADCAAAGLLCRPQKRRPPRYTLLRALDGGAQARPGDCLCAPQSREDAGFSQAEKLLRAAGEMRIKGGEIRVQALTRQSDAPDGLFDASGAPRQALYALRGALGPAALHIGGGRGPLLPGQDFSAPLFLLLETGETGAAVVRAQLFRLDGSLVAERSFASAALEAANALGDFRAALPWDCRGGLLLRLQAWRGGARIAQGHAYYPLRGEDGGALPFPPARLCLETAGGARYLCNAGHTAALGVTVRCGEELPLRYGALLPLERVEVPEKGEVRVYLGNPE